MTNLNGYRQRASETRVGEIELAIPRTGSGPSYFPSFLEPRRRREQAIVAVVMEAYVSGVSTRKVDRLVEQLGISSMMENAPSAQPPDYAEPPRATTAPTQALRDRLGITRASA